MFSKIKKTLASPLTIRLDYYEWRETYWRSTDKWYSLRSDLRHHYVDPLKSVEAVTQVIISLVNYDLTHFELGTEGSVEKLDPHNVWTEIVLLIGDNLEAEFLISGFFPINGAHLPSWYHHAAERYPQAVYVNPTNDNDRQGKGRGPSWTVKGYAVTDQEWEKETVVSLDIEEHVDRLSPF